VRILRSFGIGAPPVLAAAYLHDTVEDTDASVKDIFKAFARLASRVPFNRASAKNRAAPKLLPESLGAKSRHAGRATSRPDRRSHQEISFHLL